MSFRAKFGTRFHARIPHMVFVKGMALQSTCVTTLEPESTGKGASAKWSFVKIDRESSNKFGAWMILTNAWDSINNLFVLVKITAYLTPERTGFSQ
jgi:hypothetical protein